ncbi:hypothetical protein JTE90_009111 [Oedothorax gibbosus]|uniref:2Fe-2S ferredoxin-type domain-containing protein n=1 Tax=Oedothorax gibbosus TaxID=931172 RepID=A0AAV6UG42_9ARAC|nr:hypothetical protein JTE90_009111 [Oedothorax gibbosus]
MTFRLLCRPLSTVFFRHSKCATGLQSRFFTISSKTITGTHCLNNRLYSTPSNVQSEDNEKSEPGEIVKFTFITHDGEHVEVEGECGKTLKTVAEDYDSLMEGACEGVLACTTCHVYVPEEVADAFTEPNSKEEDLLDTAAFLKPNSRLSCQLMVSKEIEGAKFGLPKGTVNMQVDGFKPKKH